MGTTLDRRRKKKLPVVFVSVQYENVNSGPGTFTDYIIREFEDHPSFDFHFFLEDLTDSRRRLSRVKVPDNKLFGNRIVKGISYYLSIQPFVNSQIPRIIWFNTSPVVAFFYALLGKSDFLISMISDDNLAAISLGSDIKKTFLRIFEKSTLRRADMVVVNSQYLANTIETRYKINPEKIRLLYKGVSRSDFRFESPKRKILEPVKIIFIKSDYKRGGLFQLIEALKILSFEVHLTVVGPQGNDIGIIKDFALGSGYLGNINYLGKLTRDQVASALRNNDILCVPSLREALGVVFLEAMSSGISVIGSDTGGIPEVLDFGRAGWLCRPNDPNDLANTIENCIQQDEERISKIVHAKNFVERFDLQNMTKRFEIILNEISESFANDH